MQYGLSLETVKKINGVLARFEEVEEAILYGSRAKGNFKPGSDVDLTLKGKKLNLKLLNKINLDLDDLLLPYTFDISIFHQITNPDLLEHIERVGMFFYKKEGARVQPQQTLIKGIEAVGPDDRLIRLDRTTGEVTMKFKLPGF